VSRPRIEVAADGRDIKGACGAAPTRRVQTGRLAILVASILVTVLFSWGEVGAMNATDDQAVEYLDFAQLQRRGSPNDWLVAPAEEPAHLRADAQSPRFPLPAEELARQWADLVASRSRTRIIGISPDGMAVEAEQRTSLLRFVDRVSFRAVPLDAGTSSAYVYSRSQVGYWDLGVNQRRVTRWIEALQQAVQAR
jgi:uncharacterized protein (DUF1499 family)